LPVFYPLIIKSSAVITQCSGCSVCLKAKGLVLPSRFNASSACWSVYGELSEYNYARALPTFLHQLAVDAYGAQHAGELSRPITTAFAIIGMYLVHVKGFDGRQVQATHSHIGKRQHEWPNFLRPASVRAVTVQDVMSAEPGVKRDAHIREWSGSVWTAWQSQHGWAERFCRNGLI
jgi:hypothetical protein